MNADSKSADFALLAKTLFGLEEILAAELEALGAKNLNLVNRAITYRGDRELLYRSNLFPHLRRQMRARFTKECPGLTGQSI